MDPHQIIKNTMLALDKQTHFRLNVYCFYFYRETLYRVDSEHRYPRKVDCTQHISLQKILYNMSTKSRHKLLNQSMASRPKGQARLDQ
jgi:hypothetical protein